MASGVFRWVILINHSFRQIISSFQRAAHSRFYLGLIEITLSLRRTGNESSSMRPLINIIELFQDRTCIVSGLLFQGGFILLLFSGELLYLNTARRPLRNNMEEVAQR